MFTLGWFCVQLPAATLTAVVTDRAGRPAANAVMYAVPVGVKVSNSNSTPAVVSQQRYKFEPYVTVVQQGSRVRFPNQDANEHHLRVLSGPTDFEFKVYRKEPEPVMFDKLGTITLHCLLHDWMSAHIMVVPTPYFGKSTATGNVVIQDLPAGEYEVFITHPTALTQATAKRFKLSATSIEKLEHNLGFNPRSEPTPRAAPPAYSY
jgi:plastocyanin